MIKGIIFDLDDTLTIHEKIYNKEYIRISQRISKNIIDKNSLEIIIKKINEIGSIKYFKKYLDAKFGGRDILWGDIGGSGEVNEFISTSYNIIRTEIWKEITTNILGINNINISEISSNHIHNMWEKIEAYDDVIPVLLKLKRLKLAVLTNGMAIHQRRKLAKSGLLYFFSGKNRQILTSSEIKFGKPFPHGYEIIINNFKLSKNEILMVGDRPEGDILGANKLGIKSVYINRENENISNNEFRPTYEINSMYELLEIIAKYNN